MGTLEKVLASLCVIAGILLIDRFRNLLPLLADSIFRARGSSSLENSVRANNDRNLLAVSLMLPALLVIHRYRLYDAAFLRDLPSPWRLLALAGVFAVWILLSWLLFLAFKPRRGYDYYLRAHRASATYFILFMLLMLPTLGILALFRLPDDIIRMVLYVEMAVVYFIFLIRRTQILALSCNPFRTFLYLCGLEILPAVLLVISAVML